MWQKYQIRVIKDKINSTPHGVICITLKKTQIIYFITHNQIPFEIT